MELLEVNHLCKTYGSGETAVHALKDVSFSVPKGEYVAVVGESGSGKSTLLNLIGGLDTPTSGKVLIDGKDVFAMKDRELTIFRRRNIGFIFQAFNLIPELTVEQNILFPICAVNFTEEEWYGIYHDEKDYDLCFGVEQERWETAEGRKVFTVFDAVGEIVMPGGHMTVEQLTALLNTIPMEITFVDADNINRFFNEGPKDFKRPGMAIDREVFSCHPPKIESTVRRIIGEFRAGALDEVPIWMDKNGKCMLVRYMAVRDKEGKYLGTLELVQDMGFAKEHFQPEKRQEEIW